MLLHYMQNKLLTTLDLHCAAITIVLIKCIMACLLDNLLTNKLAVKSTGQLADYTTRRLDDWQTCQLIEV